jgi:hypothetical protein
VFDFVRDGTVACGDRIARIEHDLAPERSAVLSADLRQRAIRDGDEDYVSDGNRLIDSPDLCKTAKISD